jgi:hypothetical protein
LDLGFSSKNPRNLRLHIKEEEDLDNEGRRRRVVASMIARRREEGLVHEFFFPFFL